MSQEDKPNKEGTADNLEGFTKPKSEEKEQLKDLTEGAAAKDKVEVVEGAVKNSVKNMLDTMEDQVLDSEETKAMSEDDAATKIQAGFRGHMARKQLSAVGDGDEEAEKRRWGQGRRIRCGSRTRGFECVFITS